MAQQGADAERTINLRSRRGLAEQLCLAPLPASSPRGADGGVEDASHQTLDAPGHADAEAEERCDGPVDHVVQSHFIASQDTEEVFEIRDFTAASPFERLVHRLTLAMKQWAARIESTPDCEDSSHTEEFEDGGSTYRVVVISLVERPRNGPEKMRWGVRRGGCYSISPSCRVFFFT